jgi:hypothetical protein
VEAYYSKMADEFDDDEIKVPWAESDYDKASDPVPMFKGQFLGNYVEMAMCMGAVNQANYALLSTYRDALSGYGDWKDIEPDDANSRLGMCHDEHKDLCMSIHKAVASGNGAETPDEAVESAKRMEIAILSAGGLGSGLAFEKHAEVAADATRLFVERASERAAKRMREKRDVSASNRSTMQRLRDQTAKNLVDLDGLIANTEPKGAAKASELRDLELAQLRLRQAHFVRASV